MLKKLTLASVALIASSGLAFADTDNMMGSASATGTTPESSAASTTEVKPATHKHHNKHHVKKHRKHHRHHYKSIANNEAMTPPPAVEDASSNSADPAPAAGGYKGEVAAAPCPACIHNVFNTGAYVGLGVGSRVNYTSAPAVYTGIEGTLFGGYSMLWDQVYGALEIFAQDSAEINNYSGTTGSTKSSWGYGLSILPGYMITDNVLGYLRLGVVNTRFTADSANRTGGQAGLGLETALTNNWDLRGEWVYSVYNSIDAGTPRTQQFNLGLLYKFQM